MARGRAETTQALVGPFSMTDEERDIDEFVGYLAALGPDELWDVLSHLDAERYPRRHEATLRETTRRRLFFVAPYTRRELRLRTFVLCSLFLAVLASFFRVIGSFTIEVSPYEHLPFFTDLAVGSPKAARLLLPLVLPLAWVGAAGSLVVTLHILYLWGRRRFRADVAATALLATLLIWILLHLTAG